MTNLNVWKEIYASYQSDKILTGSIDGIEPVESKNGQIVNCAIVFFMEEVKILIPIKDLNLLNIEDKQKAFGESFNPLKLVNGMIGATIDFVVNEIDQTNNLAKASRTKAMGIRKHLEFAKHSVGEKILARVTSVGNGFAILETYGVETKVPVKNLSTEYVPDLKSILNVGENIEVYIKEINQIDGTITVSAINEDYDPFESNIHNYKKSSQYRGTVVNIQPFGIFVKLPIGGITALCPIPEWKECDVKIGSIVSIRISGIRYNEKKVDGNLMRIIKK